VIKASLVEIDKREVSFDNRLEIYNNGSQNDYPEKMDRLINNSVTAKTASNLMVQYLLGKGFGESDKTKVNSKTQLSEFAESIAQDLTNHKGVFIHVAYNANLKPSSFKVLPFEQCRIGRKDSKKYNGKIVVKNDWTDLKEEPRILNVYNPDKTVLTAQIGNVVEDLSKYKGQVFYYNIDSRYYYPLSRIDAVQNDCDSEARAAIYKNQLLRKGFFGKTLVVTRPLIDENVEELIHNSEGVEIRNPLHHQAETEATNVKNTIESFIGAENAGGAMVMELDFAGDNIDDAILFKNIESTLDPDLFENVEKSLRENILIAFNNIPIDLVKVSSGLSVSGEAVKANKQMYWENTSKERGILVRIINQLLGLNLKVIPLIEDDRNDVNKPSDNS
jgi:hypothetical protein